MDGYWHKFIIEDIKEKNEVITLGGIFYIPVEYLFDFMRKYPEAEDLGICTDLEEKEFLDFEK